LGGKVQGGIEPLVLGEGEECAEFLGIPHAGHGRATAAPAGRVHSQGHVAVDELTVHREVESVANDEMGFVHRLRSKGLFVAAATSQEMLVEVVEVITAQQPERYVAEAGEHVVLDDPSVAMRRGSANVSSLAWEPCLSDEPSQ
jgi:hypothetical protein